MTGIERIRAALKDLDDEGVQLYRDELDDEKTSQPDYKPSAAEKREIAARTERGSTHARYQNWYTKALPVIRQLIPERYEEFRTLFKNEKAKDLDWTTYGISDWLNHTVVQRLGGGFTPTRAFGVKFQQQVLIVRSASTRLDSILADIRGLVESELFDSASDAAAELLARGHLRAAGTLAGVTLEAHLKSVVVNRVVKLAKKDSSIAELNDALKAANVVDVPEWRRIQRLSDLRNLCAHAKDREPTRADVEELLDGVRRTVKSLY